MSDDAMTRRNLATRQAAWARALAQHLARAGVQPNAISLAGVGFAIGAAAAFLLSSGGTAGSRITWLLVVAAAIQLRLLCNLLDGMLAVEHGLKSPTGDLFNDVPDRIEDVLILASAGLSIDALPFGAALGAIAALTAMFTAYVRLLGASLGARPQFAGPMAKQHRMFVLTVAAVLGAAEALTAAPPRAIWFGLFVIAAGSIATAIRRLRRIVIEVAAQ
jgi:phosphatidylglycerophosphate synthase